MRLDLGLSWEILARGGWTNAVEEYFPEGTWQRAVADFVILDSVEVAEELLEALETGNKSVIAQKIAGLACDLGKACKAVSKAISKIPSAKKAAAGIKKFFGRLKDKISGKSVPNTPPRVRHHTDAAGAKGITKDGAIDPARPADGSPVGVHVEREPFGPSRTGSAETGAFEEGRFVEFDEPGSIVSTKIGPRRTGVVPTDTPLDISDLNPKVGRQ